MGFLVSQHSQLGAIPPPPFLSISPLESMQSGGAIPPPLKRGISAIPARYPMKNTSNGCDTPLCDTISKGSCAIWGGISHWAAKILSKKACFCLRVPSRKPLLRTPSKNLPSSTTHSKTPSKDPSQNLPESSLEKHSKTLLRSVLLHDPFGDSLQAMDPGLGLPGLSSSFSTVGCHAMGIEEKLSEVLYNVFAEGS